MHRQTVDELMPLLTILDQPAFCIRSNGTLAFNKAAKNLVPSCAAALPNWLGDGKVLYDLWDRTGNLQIPVTLCDLQYSVTLQALQDGTLFLMAPCSVQEQALDVLSVASQTLRQPLSDLCSLFYLMTGNGSAEQADGIYRQLHRLTRMVSNFSELARLNSEDLSISLLPTDTDSFLASLLEELQTLCQSAGRVFQYTLPAKPVSFAADQTLLKRAVLNLVSNALKFSPPQSTLEFRVEVIGTHLVFQLTNPCTDDGQELLRAAFDRLSQRGILPDPTWGMGLGLPIANAIARLHGGMVAVETANSKATVSLSVSRRKVVGESKLSSAFAVDYAGGMRQTLLELSDVLPNSFYRY